MKHLIHPPFQQLADSIYRLTHWEYWSPRAIYLPLAPFWLYFALRNRRLFFFENANPGLPFGGMAMTPKHQIYQKFPSRYIPETILVDSADDPQKKFRQTTLQFPVVAKPDHGLKGLGVEILQNEQALRAYQKKYRLPFLIQEKVPYSREVGIFYCRYPNQATGFITGIVHKEFLHVTGDGKRTLEKLVQSSYRTRSQQGRIRQFWEHEWSQVIEAGTTMTLLPIGSHTRGAEFTDFSRITTPQLTSCIDGIARQLTGFYYGRFDILFQDEDSLRKGENFKIIELNGAMSEPTHMYDPRYSIWFAWREIIRHWKILSNIALQNRKKMITKTSFLAGIYLFIANLRLERQLKKMLCD